MKKLLYISLICLMMSVFCSTTASTAKTTDVDIVFALIPYEKVLKKLTDEYGVTMYVPEENKEKFYNNVKGLTTRQFEKQMRQQFEEAKQYIPKASNSAVKEGGIFGPLPLPNATQTIPAIPIN